MTFTINFGNQVGRGDIERDAGREGKREFDGGLYGECQNYSGESRGGDQRGRARRRLIAAPGSERDRSDSEAFGDFVQEYRDEEEQSQSETREQPGSDCDAVEESVKRKRDDRSGRHPTAHHFVGMCLFAEMEVWRDGVFDELDQQVARQRQAHWFYETPLPLQSDFRNHF